MRIVCPSCAARYEIADAMLAKPRTVRCSRCAREWVQDPIPPAEPDSLAPETDELPPAGEASPEQAMEPVPAPPVVPPERLEAFLPTRPAKEVARRAAPALALAWIASLLILAGLAFAAYTYRAPIQAAWPPSERVFRLLPA